MLKRVNDLTDLIKEYNGLYNEFENKKLLFNLRVDDLCEDYDCGIHPLGLTEEQLSTFDNYAKAKHFFIIYDDIIKGLNRIKDSNKGADRKTLNSLYAKYLCSEYGFDYVTAYFYISNYNIYIEAGFYKTISSEVLVDNCLRRVTRQTSILKKQGLNAYDDFVEDAKAKLKPYTVEVISKVRPVVHMGSKTLAKVFGKIADKTKEKND